MDVLIGIAILLLVAATAIHMVHIIPSKSKSTLSIFLTVGGIILSFLWAIRANKEINEALTRTKETLVKQDSLSTARQNSMLDSLRLLRLDHAKAMTMHDSMLMRIARVDSCIDRHFRHINRRISYLRN